MQSDPESQALEIALRSFRRRCLTFLAPLFVVAAPALAILISSQECYIDVDRIFRTTADNPVLVGFAYNQQQYTYLKYQRLSSMPRQSIVALGSSRVLGFREEMFDAEFFNAGYTIVSPWDFRTFLNELPREKLPKVLILGLDQWMFSKLGNTKRQRRAATTWTRRPKDDLSVALRLVPDVYKDLVRGRISVTAVMANALGLNADAGTTRIGLSALINRKGMRQDGSFLYSTQVQKLLTSDPTANDYQFAGTLARVQRLGRRFEPGSEVDEEAVAEVDRLLDFCRANSVSVVGFLPPFADAVWQAMQDSGEHVYMTRIQSELQAHFDKHGFELYAFHRMSDCNANDQEAIDGFHAGENAHTKMLIAMLKSGSLLNKYTALDRLQHDVQVAVNRYISYPEQGPHNRRLADVTPAGSRN